MDNTLLSVFLGGLITAGFTWFLNWRNSVREDIIHNKRRKEEAYCQVLSIYGSSITRYSAGISTDDIIPIIEKTRGVLLAFGSEKVILMMPQIEEALHDYLKHKNPKVNEVFDILIKQIRKELGTKD